MNKSLLIASCAVLTASVFGMDSGEFSEIGRKRSNSLSSLVDKQSCSNQESDSLLGDVVKKQISVVNNLKGKLAEKTQENRELASRNELLTRQLDDVQKTGESSDRPRNEELIRQLMESFQQLNLQSVKPEIKETEPHKTYEFVNNRLYFFEKIGNTNAYKRLATPTTVNAVADNWNDISEIRYANDVSYDKLKNPKTIFYRNKDDSCYIILRISGNKHGVFYGVNANDIEVGENSFSVYDVSQDVGSFTDNILRQIYVDKSGLYFVPTAENSLESVIDAYQKGGKFDFNGSILKISAFDGSITWNNQPVTIKNFFDNWIEKEREIERQISKEMGRTVIEKVKTTTTVVSTKKPEPGEIIKNFYPPEGSYAGILKSMDNVIGPDGWSSIFSIFIENSQRDRSRRKITLGGREWIDFFVKRIKGTYQKN